MLMPNTGKIDHGKGLVAALIVTSKPITPTFPTTLLLKPVARLAMEIALSSLASFVRAARSNCQRCFCSIRWSRILRRHSFISLLLADAERAGIAGKRCQKRWLGRPILVAVPLAIRAGVTQNLLAACYRLTLPDRTPRSTCARVSALRSDLLRLTKRLVLVTDRAESLRIAMRSESRS